MATSTSLNQNTDDKNNNNEDIIQSGDCVIIIDQSRKSQPITIGSKYEQRFHRKKDLDFSVLIGNRYGSVFELKSNELIKRPASEWCSFQNETSLDSEHKEVRDNSNINRNTKNQQLTEEQILKLKSDADVSKHSLISQIAQSSKTFHLKTEFSKEKYLKQKKTKHKMVKLLTLKANAASLTEMYFHRKPDKTMSIRMDTVSQIMSLANVHHSQYVLVVESCTGLMIGSIAERMDGTGKIFNIYCGKHPSIEIGNNLFHRVRMQNVNNVNIGLFNDKLWREDNEENDAKLKEMVDTNVKLSKYKDMRPNLYQIKQWIKFEKCDSLIICSQHHPLTLLRHLYQYLDFGCPFIIYSEFIQPLTEIKDKFFVEAEENEAVSLRIHENWFREHQVLPHRTHPHVNMNQAGGYILSGIKVRMRPSRLNVKQDNVDDADGDIVDHDNPSKKRKVVNDNPFLQ